MTTTHDDKARETPLTDAAEMHGSKTYNHPRYDKKLVKLCRELETKLNVLKEAEGKLALLTEIPDRDSSLEEAARICDEQAAGWIPNTSAHALARRVEAELCAQKIRSLQKRSLVESVPQGYKVVPILPTEEQWNGLARMIVMWWGFGGRPTGYALYEHLKHAGVHAPVWLQAEIHNDGSVPPKGTVAACIYRAMLENSPPAPPTEEKSL
jgi:hypothetical protein